MHNKGDTGQAARSAASPWIARFAGLVEPSARLLDLACGGGRHGRLFLGKGCQVSFLDIDLTGVADLGDGAELIQADLEVDGDWPLGARQWDAVIVTNYLWRPRWLDLIGCLAPGGLLLYETFMHGQERFGKPSNPAFLLAPNELYERCKDCFEILAFEQGEDTGLKPAMRQRIAARKY